MQVNIEPVDYEIVAHRKTVKRDLSKIYKTTPRKQTNKLDIFPYTNRTLIDYNKYHKYITKYIKNTKECK